MESPIMEYPEMSPLILETVMKMTIEKVKTHRTGGVHPSASGPAVNEEQQQKPIPFPRSKSTSLLRTLLIIQIGRKASRLLSLISQPDLYRPPKALPQGSSALEVPQSTVHGNKRRSSDEEKTKVEQDSVSGPSSEKSPCMEGADSAFVFPPRPSQSSPTLPEDGSSGEISPVSRLNHLSLHAPNSEDVYSKDSCPGCKRCSINSVWMRPQSAPKLRLCEPVRQC
ncbi:unnamed protein product [Mesocestoides corti]|uniref:Uncharacterized protein n=2 Tax=Mesocestoides corti TaxID=53468 RepID=A0A0R3UEL6_MESCO|nr:unnamed protein product [Mesocestoides corti]